MCHEQGNIPQHSVTCKDGLCNALFSQIGNIVGLPAKTVVKLTHLEGGRV